MRIYLDNASTTFVAPEVRQSMNEVMLRYEGNPSSLHHLGVQAEQLLKRSREQIANLLGASASEVVFTSGGTESNNMAIKGTAFGYRGRGRHIITTKTEHASVFETCRALEQDFGYEVTYVSVDTKGLVDPEEVLAAVREDTLLVTIMHVNSELGTVQPVREIGKRLLAFPKTLFHIDHVQGVGKVPLQVRDFHADLVSISGHKIHGPQGTGALYVRDSVHLYPLLHGGAQQTGRRAGTENVPGIVGLAKALRLVLEQQNDHIRNMRRLKSKTEQALATMQGVELNSLTDPSFSAPHIVNASFTGIKPEVLLHALEEKGIYVSTKSACSSKDAGPSRVLTESGLPSERAGCAIRIAFSIHNTEEEVDTLIKALTELVPYYQNIMNSPTK
jgi:cysteine desulfurase